MKIEKVKCEKCNQTLLKVENAEGEIEVKCPRCKLINRIRLEDQKTEPRATPLE
ncbi:MAG: Com family DNA-binding transcriptional regulator [Firmicutes bacterium]|nr:Com family DNA-binding transcriptional regulator [Bacillota bacterium]